MPWGGNPASDEADAVRALVGDTDSSSPLLPDGTYELIIATETRLYARAAMACSALAGKYGHEMTKRVGSLWREAKVLYQHFRDLSQWYRLENQRRAPGGPFLGGAELADVENRKLDDTMSQPAFDVGMTDAVPADGEAE